MPDVELGELFDRLTRQVEPSPELLDEIRAGIRAAERRRRLRVAIVIITMLVAMTVALVVLELVRTRDNGRQPDPTPSEQVEP